MRFTRIAGTYPTRAEAEAARSWAAEAYPSQQIEVRRHRCRKPGHRRRPWLVVSVVRVEAGEEQAPVTGANGQGRPQAVSVPPSRAGIWRGRPEQSSQPVTIAAPEP